MMTSWVSANSNVKGQNATTSVIPPPPRVTSGSTWTFYQFGSYSGPAGIDPLNYPPPCELLTFSDNTFSGDKGDSGTWTSRGSKTTLHFDGTGNLSPGKFTGQGANNVPSYAGVEVITPGGENSSPGRYGPDGLVEGNDPLDAGHC